MQKLAYECFYCGIKFEIYYSWGVDSRCPCCDTTMNITNILPKGINNDPFGYEHKKPEESVVKGNYFGYKE